MEKKRFNFKKLLCVGMAGVLTLGMLAGCGNKSASGGKVQLSVGNWPSENEPSRLAVYEEYVKKMNEKYPDIEIVPDTYDYNLETFIVRAASDQIPTLYRTWYTEIQKVINAGAAKDITDIMHEKGWDSAMNPDVLALCSKDGKIYATPQDGYAQGLFINKKVFTEAGLLNDDGSVKIPQTWQEVAEFGQIIREKTGKNGFAFPTTGNIGGWHFMNIAWSYGVEFVKEEDGKYYANFVNQECIDALQYLKDLKWKYNAVQDNALVDRAGINELFATDKAGMYIADPPNDDLITYLDMDKSNIVFARMPEGPEGRYTQMGGNVWMIAPSATDEQVDAALKWLEITGESPVMDESAVDALTQKLNQRSTDGLIVFDQVPFKMWVNDERNNKEEEVRTQFLNVDPKDYEDYFGFKDVIIKPEEAASAQELYTLLDSCIQEIFTNKDADVAALVKKANSDFQTNHLNKLD